MSIASRPSFLRRFSVAVRQPQGPDLADMGTAFALDHILDEMHERGLAEAQHGAQPVSAWRRWLGHKLGH